MEEGLNNLSKEELIQLLNEARLEVSKLKDHSLNNTFPGSKEVIGSEIENFGLGIDRFRLFFDSMSIGGYFSTPEGRFLQVNSAFVQMLGYQSEKEVMSLHIPTQVFANESDRETMLGLAAHNDQTVIFYTAITKDGQKILIEDHIRFIRNNSGNVQFIEGICYDITEKRKIEEALQLSEERFRLMTEFLPQAVWETDTTGVFTYINPSGVTSFGYDINELDNRKINIFSVLAPEEHQRAANYVKELFTGLESKGREYTAVKKDGTRFPVIIYSSIVEKDGHIVGLRGITVDISELKEKEEKYRSTRLQLQAILDAATEVSIIATNPQGIIMVFNSGAEKMLGYSAKEVIGKASPLIFHLDNEITEASEELLIDTGKEFVGFEVLIARARLSGTETREWTYVRKDGSKIIVSLVVSEVKDAHGKVMGYLGIGRNITGQKKAEQTLIESELKYRTLFENLSDAVFTMNEEVFLECNNKIKDIFKCDKKDIIGFSPIKFSPIHQPNGELSVEKAARHIKAVMAGEPQSFEWVHRTLDGIEFYAEVNLTRTQIGEENLIQAIVRDINEKKKAEEAVRLSEERFRILLDNMSEVFMLVDNDDRVLYVNKRFTEVLGYTKEEIVGEIGYQKLISPEDHAVIVEANKDRIKNKQGQYELHFNKKNGGRVLFLVNGAPYKDAKGNVAGSIGTMTDITERKEAEFLLQKSQQLFQTLALISPVGIFRTDEHGKTTYVNPKWTELSGLSMEKAMDDDWLNAVHPDDQHILIQGWKEKSSIGEKSSAEYRFLKPDGSVVWVMGYAVPEIINGKIRGYVGTITDISERKQAEIELQEKNQLIEAQNEEYLQINEELIQMNEELNQARLKAEESDRLKSAFLANMSHEIRTPLNGIIGFAHVLSDLDLNEHERREYTKTLHISCNRLLNTVNDILDISKIDAGQTDVKAEYYEPVVLLRELLLLQAPNFKNKGIQLRLNLQPGLTGLKVFGDEQKVYQVLNNLLDNALKFTREGHVELGGSLHNDRIEYYVSDTGIGIAKDHQDFVFGRFNQENITLTREHEGSGLGLAITKGLVELMQGTILLESEKGKGSVFRVNLPVALIVQNADDENHYSEKFDTDDQLFIGSILIAEDDEVNYQLLYSILRTATHERIIRAHNGLEAIKAMEVNNDIALVLMDLKMPGMDGFEAISKIRAINSDVTIVVISAFAHKADEHKAIKAGSNGYIRKPFNPSGIISKIKEIIVTHNKN